MISCSFFIPTYNDECIIKETIKEVSEYAASKGMEFEIIAVDDNSGDETAQICRLLEEELDFFRFVSFDIGPSKRENLARSFHIATKRYIVFMDSDLAVPLRHLDRMFELLSNGEDVIIGSKFLPESRVKRPFHRVFFSRGYNLIARMLFHTGLSDHNSGFKGFRRDLGVEIAYDMGFDESFRRGWFWDVEFLIRAIGKNARIYEIPISYEHRHSTFKLMNEVRLISYLLHFWYKHPFGRNPQPNIRS